MTNNTALLTAVLAAYGLGDAQTQLVQARRNHIYRVSDAAGKTYCLRLCPQSMEVQHDLADELRWLAFVAAQGQVAVPQPLPNRDGHLFTITPTADGTLLSCLFPWLPGQPLSDNHNAAVARALGRSIAALHEASRQFAFPPDAPAFRADYVYDQALLRDHHDWIALRRSELSDAQHAILKSAIAYALNAFDQLPRTPSTYGFIHADINDENILADGERVAIIDHEQLGRGFFAYDLARLRVALEVDPAMLAAVWPHVLAGYAAVTPLPFADDVALEPFVVAMRLAFLDWVYNTPNPDVRAEQWPKVEPTYAALVAATAGQ